MSYIHSNGLLYQQNILLLIKMEAAYMNTRHEDFINSWFVILCFVLFISFVILFRQTNDSEFVHYKLSFHSAKKPGAEVILLKKLRSQVNALTRQTIKTLITI